MVDNPERCLGMMGRAGCDLFIFHLEFVRYLRRMVDRVHEAGMKCGVAINPSTPTHYIDVGHYVELVLVMGVEPGFASQPWFERTPLRVEEIRKRVATDTSVGVDGHRTWRGGGCTGPSFLDGCFA